MGDMAYDLCGWHVSSAIPLPDLPVWRGAPGTADVTLVLGDVPELEDRVMTTPFLQVARDGRMRFVADKVAAYRIENGNRITIAPQISPEAAEVRLFLLGTAFGCLCHQRGVVPIHGSTVVIDGTAVVFAGDSGAGKSTLADGFARRGYPILADDVSTLDLSAPRGLVLPNLRRIKLWRDAIDHAGWPQSDLERCREGMEKFSRALHDAPPGPFPPGALFHLRRHSARQPRAVFRRLRGRAAAQEFERQIYRGRALGALAGKAGAMARSMRAASVFPHHFIVERAIDFAHFEAGIDDIVNTVRAAFAGDDGGTDSPR